MTAADNLARVQHILAEFSKTRNKQPLYDAIAPDAVLTIPRREAPLARTHRGPEGLVEYFAQAEALIELLDLRVQRSVADANTVVVIGDERYRIRASGNVYTSEWVLVFTFDEDAKITSMRSFEDMTLQGSES